VIIRRIVIFLVVFEIFMYFGEYVVVVIVLLLSVLFPVQVHRQDKIWSSHDG